MWPQHYCETWKSTKYRKKPVYYPANTKLKQSIRYPTNLQTLNHTSEVEPIVVLILNHHQSTMDGSGPGRIRAWTDQGRSTFVNWPDLMVDVGQTSLGRWFHHCPHWSTTSPCRWRHQRRRCPDVWQRRCSHEHGTTTSHQAAEHNDDFTTHCCTVWMILSSARIGIGRSRGSKTTDSALVLFWLDHSTSNI